MPLYLEIRIILSLSLFLDVFSIIYFPIRFSKGVQRNISKRFMFVILCNNLTRRKVELDIIACSVDIPSF